MTSTVIPNKEQQRLQALWDLEILDTPTDPTFENLTQIAQSLFEPSASTKSDFAGFYRKSSPFIGKMEKRKS